jgi:hypothetical protein
MPDPIFTKFDMCIMVTGHTINPSHRPVCLYVHVYLQSLLGKGSVQYTPRFGARQRLGKQVSPGTNARNNGVIVERLFCVRSVLY